jgi:hypothetical protein
MKGNKAMENKMEAKPKPQSDRIAQRDFVICHNDYFRQIKEGEDLSDVPALYLENLKTEGVLT